MPIIHRALEKVYTDHPVDEELRWLSIASVAAPEVHDDRAWQTLTTRRATAERTHGTIIAGPVGLGRSLDFDVVAGRYAAVLGVATNSRAVTSMMRWTSTRRAA